MADLIAALQKVGLEVDYATRSAEVKGWLHSGNYTLNYAMSGRFLRGYPLGHTTEIFGDNSTGKSLLMARALAEAQVAGGVALLDDVEGALNLDWATQIGVDVDALAHVRSTTVHQHSMLMQKLMTVFDKEEVTLAAIGLDSIAALTTEHEMETLEKNTKDMQRAQEIHKLFRTVGAVLKRHVVAYIVANHKIAPMSMFTKADSTGGGGPKYYSSVRLDLRTPKQLKDARQDAVGVVITAVVFKTRFTPPWKKIEMVIPFYQPISAYSGLLPELERLEIIGVRGSDGRISVDGTLTELKATKNPINNDSVAAELIAAYPDLLERADAMLAERERTVRAMVWDEDSGNPSDEPE